VTIWTNVFLGVIALATLTTAIMQVGLLIAAGRLISRLSHLIDHVERELAPVFVHVNAIAKDASRAAAVATAQVERIDALITDMGQRAGQALNAFQVGLGVPAKEGRAFMTALRTVFKTLRQDANGRRRRSRADDEDALFI
jgi:hypothetical protein